MRVGLDVRVCLSNVVGTGRYAVELGRALTVLGVDAQFWYARWRTGARDEEVTALLHRLAPEVPLRRSMVPNAAIYSARAQALWRTCPAWALPGWLPRDLDVYHAVYWPLPLDRRVPMVLTIHDLIPLRHPEWFVAGQRTDLDTVRAIAPRVAHIVTDSDHTRREVLELLDCAPERVTTVYLGVDSERFAPPSANAVCEVRRRYGLERPYLMVLGSIEPRKNLGRLLDAFDLVCRQAGLELDLVLAGAEAWGEDVLSGRLANPRPGRVHRLGYVPLEDLPVLLGAAEATAYVSLAEGFGLPPLEAMASGCPVVTSNCTSLPEVAGDAAVLVDPYDVDAIAAGLAEALTDPARAAELRQRGLQRAAQFTWDATAAKTLKVYEQVLAGSPSRRRAVAG